MASQSNHPISITHEQAAAAFADWKNEYRKDPAGFYTSDEIAQMEGSPLSELRSIAFFAYLRQVVA